MHPHPRAWRIWLIAFARPRQDTRENVMALSAQEQYRKLLLPKWVRFFCWIFLVAGVLTPVLPIVGLFSAMQAKFSLFGWEHYGSPLDLYSLLVTAYFVSSGIAAFGLLWGKRWGWAAGMTVGILGLTLALGYMVAHPPWVATQDGYGFRFRLEPFFQIPFIVVLWRRRSSWLSQTNGDTRNVES
jgi:hypothetical protein